MKNIIMALGDNAKFYPNYLTNHVASDFKIHLEGGIGEMISERNDLREENADLREMLLEHMQAFEGVDDYRYEETKKLLNKND
ncbi:conserved hypothetical protein [Vibrio phage 466E53-1]|nr:conserved hypothetical protein [Vibrio phage 466E53-1]